MASTAHKTAEEPIETIDDPDTLEAKLDALAEWVQQQSAFTVFTGAGVSKNLLVIPDFRAAAGRSRWVAWAAAAAAELMD